MSEPEDDFATLFEASTKVKPLERGQTVEGRIVGITAAVAFIDVGGKGEATIDVAELKDADGNLEVAVGERIQAVVTSTAGGLTLSRRLVRGAVSNKALTDAFNAGLAVEGKVEKVLKGGYEVRLAKERAFCPFSQIDVVRTADPEVHVGKTYTFRITEYGENGRNLVVSRRALLEDEQRAAAAVVRRTIVPGAVLTGRVVSVRDFGAFIDLGGGIQGLLHVSEMAWSRVNDPSKVVTPGEEITVKVLRVDEATEKISLGLKQLIADPWLAVKETYAVGQVRNGRITRVTDFGAFVELEAGVEGLAHATTFPPTGRADGWKKTVSSGQTGAFEILTIDLEQKRIGVAMLPEGSTAADRAAATPQGITPGARVTGKVDHHEKFGVFVFLGPSKIGLIPMSETGVDREADLTKAFPIGADVEVMVLEADSTGRRIRLSRKALIQAQEQAELREYTERSDSGGGGFGASLADKLRGALKQP